MSEINRKSLEETFDLDEAAEQEIETFKEVLKKAKEIEDPTNVLSSIIEKAGTFLDLIEREAANGSMNARYMEVAAQMINAIMAASASIATINSTKFNDELKGYKTGQKDRELDQKDEELRLKGLYYDNKKKEEEQKQLEGGTTNNNIIVTDRETMLEFLQNEKKKKQEEQKQLE